jgi:hypothetical protein
MKWYVTERSEKVVYLSSIGREILFEKGWGNGYVAIPPTHPAYKMDYDIIDVDIHYGLTYSQYGDGVNAPIDWWVFGFDTAHYGDTLEKWPKEAVEAETKRLFCQLLDIELGEL